MEKKDFVKLNKETYNKIAKPFFHTRKFLWDDIKSLIKYVKAGDKVLDLGCGTGRLCQLFKDFQPFGAVQGKVEYVGVDNSEGQIAVAKENYPKAKFIVADMLGLPFADKEFDAVFCIATFHHLLDKENQLMALKEMKRVLKNSGRLIMTNWNLFSEWSTEKAKNEKWKVMEGNNLMVPWKNSKRDILGERFYHGFTLEELEKLFREVGFKMVEQYYTKRSWKGEKTIESGNIINVVRKD